MVLGEQIYESKGKKTGFRVLTEMKLETSEQLQGKFYGIEGTELSTITSEPRSDGTLFGEVNGIFTARDGQTVSYKGQGVGQRESDGSISLRGAVYYWTASQNFARSNRIVGVFEVETDSAGNVVKKVWEWK